MSGRPFPARPPGRTSRGRRFHGRKGLTLLEVVLAIAILAISAAALGELLRIGSDNARLVRETTMAQIFCEGKFAELQSGVAQIAPVAATPLPENPEWNYTVEVQQVELQGVLSVKVTVSKPLGAVRQASFSLSGWLPDPAFIPIAPATSSSTAAGTSTTGS